ncbi:MAG: hypothetical protein H8F28_27005 [Fibrella sp.]|nr:hypothetical protein [Armatimonadota bacterium]
MSLTLKLPPEMDSKLRARAARRGMTPEDYLKAIAIDRLRPRRTSAATLTPQETAMAGSLLLE